MSLLLVAATSALAQTGAGAAAPKPTATAAAPIKTKVAIVDVLAFRESVGELKVKYEKLQTEFASRYREVEAMQNSISTKEKVLGENKNLTPQQSGKLTEEIAQLKKDYERYVQDSQDMAQKRERAETAAIYDKLSKFLEQYCAKHSITQVFDARRLQETNLIVYAAPAANITADFVKEYNKANPAQAASNK